MELAQGGSLLDYVRQRKRLAEPEACCFLQQIVHGLMHCHDMEVQSANPHDPVPLHLHVMGQSYSPDAGSWCMLLLQSHAVH